MRLAAVLLAALLAWPGPSAAQQPLRPWHGGVTPPLRLVDTAGRTHQLSEYRGKVVLINFWATWCAPCREEMPSIERLRRAMQGEPFAVLAVNLAEPQARVRQYLQAMPLRFPVLLDPDMAVAKAWKVRQLPASFVVGPDGRIRYSHVGELDWSGGAVRKTIAELLPR
ncbi:MAG: TlpA family protein disulfide reductase [Betaproteobacteria bacterium]|nr:TlpA family protein disulfide reductase [Betaproteobacteria bacterium]